MKPRLAWVGVDRQIHVMDVEGQQRRQLTVSLASNPLLVWGRPDLMGAIYGWPCWDPSGQRVACFETRGRRGVQPVHAVHVIEQDGQVEREILTSTDRIPLYAAWQPQGKGLALLHQAGDHLELSWCGLQPGASERVLEEGGPLFFTWAPEGRTVFAHVATPEGRRQGRLVARDVLGERPDVVFPDEPGNYCCPIVAGDRLVHVIRSPGGHHLVATDFQGENGTVLLEFMGLGAIVPGGPDAVLFTAAPQGEGTPYRGLTRFDLHGGPPRRLTDINIAAVFHHPPTGRTLVVAPESDRPWLAWWLFEPGGEAPRKLVRFQPSREQVFLLHFFEQFHDSHPPISPDGRWLTWSGRCLVDGRVPSTDRVWVLDLEGDAEPRNLAAGQLATFPPVTAAS